MKLWRISQDVVDGYDTYDSAVVAAETEAAAKTIHPRRNWNSESWCNSPKWVKAELIGEAVAGTKSGVILASFNAG